MSEREIHLNIFVNKLDIDSINCWNFRFFESHRNLPHPSISCMLYKEEKHKFKIKSAIQKLSKLKIFE